MLAVGAGSYKCTLASNCAFRKPASHAIYTPPLVGAALSSTPGFRSSAHKWCARGARCWRARRGWCSEGAPADRTNTFRTFGLPSLSTAPGRTPREHPRARVATICHVKVVEPAQRARAKVQVISAKYGRRSTNGVSGTGCLSECP